MHESGSNRAKPGPDDRPLAPSEIPPQPLPVRIERYAGQWASANTVIISGQTKEEWQSYLWDLVEAAKQEGPAGAAAFGRLYSETYASVYWGITGIVRSSGYHDKSITEDTVADAYLQAFQSLDKVTRSGSSPEGWIFRIAQRKWYDFWKRPRRWLETPSSDLAVYDEHSLSAQNTTEDIGQTMLARTLHAAVDKLVSEEQRQAIVKRYLEGKSLEIIAEELEVTRAVARKRIYRGLAAMSIILGQDHPEINQFLDT